VATRNQIRLSFLLWMVVISALSFTAIPYLGWAVGGFPYQIRYVRVVMPDGSSHLMDSRVWEIHHLNPKNRVADQKTMSR
jgi:hypothetical protein